METVLQVENPYGLDKFRQRMGYMEGLKKIEETLL